MLTKEPKTVFFFLSHPIQYFSPFLKQAAREFDLVVYYYSDKSIKGGKDKGFGKNIKWDIPLLDGYRYHFLRDISFTGSSNNRLFDHINPGVFSLLFSRKAKVFIVNDWSYLTTLFVIFFSKLTGKKVWLRVESNYSIEQQLPPIKRAIKKFYLKSLLFRYFIDRYLYIGKGNYAFLRNFGVPEEKMMYAPYAVDNQFFQEQRALLKQNVGTIKDELGIPENHVVILFSGKLIPRKRPMDILEAFRLMKRSDVSLLFIGDGELRGQMEDFIVTNGLVSVRILGFVNQAGISKMYVLGDIFVLTSEEDTWGLVVNEAMNFHMPVIVSDGVGCGADLVIPGETGYIYERGNTTQLAGYLGELIDNPSLRKKMGDNAAVTISRFMYQTGVANIKSALKSI